MCHEEFYVIRDDKTAFNKRLATIELNFDDEMNNLPRIKKILNVLLRS